MESRIARELKLKHQPVAVVLTDARPEGATQFQEGRWGCVAAMHNAAAKGRTVVFDRKTYGCPGGGVGLGFGDRYATDMPFIAEFLSTGGPQMEGEFFWKSPEHARAFVDGLPMADVPTEYVVFRPLADVDPATAPPALVSLHVNAAQLSALVVLANYGRKTTDNVICPMAAACQSVCLIPLREAQRDPPRAVVGMFDISARARLNLEADLLSFSMPYHMFLEMEANVEGSFLQHEAWRKVASRLPDPAAA